MEKQEYLVEIDYQATYRTTVSGTDPTEALRAVAEELLDDTGQGEHILNKSDITSFQITDSAGMPQDAKTEGIL